MSAEPGPVARIVFNQAMLSLQEISERLEIQQLLVDYSTAIDQRRFDDLDKVFTPDAYIDFWVTKGHLSTAGLPTALLKGSPCDVALRDRLAPWRP